MFPEKPKRQPKKRHFNLSWLLIAILALPLPLTVLSNRRVETGHFVDMLLIGFMLCCAIYILYQGVIWVLRAGSDSLEDDETLT